MGYTTSSEALSLGSADVERCKLSARLGAVRVTIRVRVAGPYSGSHFFPFLVGIGEVTTKRVI